MHAEESHNPPKALWPSLTIGFLMILLFWLGAKALLELPDPVPVEDAERSAERLKAYEDMQAENASRLTQFVWADREKGNVQIPIDLAMNLAVERLRKLTPVPAGPVNPPPAPAATPAESPAQPADEPPAPAPANPEATETPADSTQ
jgi:hypothetical protein